jgi:RF-1 domain
VEHFFPYFSTYRLIGCIFRLNKSAMRTAITTSTGGILWSRGMFYNHIRFLLLSSFSSKGLAATFTFASSSSSSSFKEQHTYNMGGRIASNRILFERQRQYLADTVFGPRFSCLTAVPCPIHCNNNIRSDPLPMKDQQWKNSRSLSCASLSFSMVVQRKCLESIVTRRIGTTPLTIYGTAGSDHYGGEDSSCDSSDDDNSNNPKPSFGMSSGNNDWIVPNYVSIPEDQIEFAFVRSSGAGGQNVNKVNSQVQIRFHVMSAHWLPYEVRQRLSIQQSKRMNNAGYITIAVQEYRTQIANRKEALAKLQRMILEAWPRPKLRKVPKVGLSVVTKERRKEEKQKRKQKKELRRPVDLY